MGSSTAGFVSNKSLLQAHGYQARIEDLVFVMIENQTMGIVVPRGERVVLQSWIMEAVVQRNLVAHKYRSEYISVGEIQRVSKLSTMASAMEFMVRNLNEDLATAKAREAVSVRYRR
jgi:hypothetical protein